METVARRFFVRGRVQGVGFRWFVIDAAQRLYVTGWTRNLPDGSVEVMAQGSPKALESFATELSIGPAAARVAGVEPADAEVDPGLKGFHVRY